MPMVAFYSDGANRWQGKKKHKLRRINATVVFHNILMEFFRNVTVITDINDADCVPAQEERIILDFIQM